MRKRVFNCLMSIVFLSLMKTAHAVETRDPLEVFYGRLTPQGRAKLGVSREKLMAEGHVGTRAEANTQAGDYNWQNTPDGASAQGVYNRLLS